MINHETLVDQRHLNMRQCVASFYNLSNATREIILNMNQLLGSFLTITTLSRFYMLSYRNLGIFW